MAALYHTAHQASSPDPKPRGLLHCRRTGPHWTSLGPSEGRFCRFRGALRVPTSGIPADWSSVIEIKGKCNSSASPPTPFPHPQPLTLNPVSRLPCGQACPSGRVGEGQGEGKLNHPKVLLAKTPHLWYNGPRRSTDFLVHLADMVPQCRNPMASSALSTMQIHSSLLTDPKPRASAFTQASL